MAGQVTVAVLAEKLSAHLVACEKQHIDTNSKLDTIFRLLWAVVGSALGLLITAVIGLLAFIWTIQVDRPAQAGPVAISGSPQNYPQHIPAPGKEIAP